jgi:membrane fusion protein (multidrug efflux system)
VKKGELIMRIDAETQQQALKSARAAAQLAKANYERVQNLSQKGVSTDEALDQAESTLRQTEATLSIAEQNLADAHLKSPIDGIVDELPFDVGEFVNRGQMVARIVDIASVEVVVNVPEKDVTYLKEGQTVEVQLPGTDAGEVSGKIERIRLVADQMSRTYRVEARIPNTDGELRPGMITKMQLTRRENPEAIVLPMFAILQTQDGPVVYLENDGTAQMRAVKTGARRGKEVEVLSGLEPGERLIVKGHRTLTDGALVKVLEEEPETAKVDDKAENPEL